MKLELGKFEIKEDGTYRLQVRDLFGGTSLIREWGRIGTRGQTLIEHHPDEGRAINSLLKLARTKKNRGYGG